MSFLWGWPFGRLKLIAIGVVTLWKRCNRLGYLSVIHETKRKPLSFFYFECSNMNCKQKPRYVMLSQCLSWFWASRNFLHLCVKNWNIRVEFFWWDFQSGSKVGGQDTSRVMCGSEQMWRTGLKFLRLSLRSSILQILILDSIGMN